MTAWTKVTKNSGKGAGRRPARTTPAVVRYKGGNAHLVLPAGYTDAKAADVFSDGNGKLGFTFSNDGDYSIHKPSKSATTSRLGIPTRFKDRIPLGTTDVVLTADGVVTVLDLSQFDGVAG